MPWFTDPQTLADPLPVQQVTLRQGDRLSSFATVIEDEYGNPLVLTDARCYLTLRPLTVTATTPMVERVELTIENALTGLVSYDWQASQTLGASPGQYDVLIDVEYASGVIVTVPSADQASTVNLRSSIASNYFELSDEGYLISDGEGGFVIIGVVTPVPEDALLGEDGFAFLTEGGSYMITEDSALPADTILTEGNEGIFTEDGDLLLIE